MNWDVRVANAVKDLVDKSYHLGPSSDGYDCIAIIQSFYGAMGVDLPKEYKGFTIENYAERWVAGEGRSEFLEYLTGLGKEVGANYMLAGDLMVFEHNGQPYPGIYLGNGHVICAFEKGVKVLPHKFLLKNLVSTRRLECPR